MSSQPGLHPTEVPRDTRAITNMVLTTPDHTAKILAIDLIAITVVAVDATVEKKEEIISETENETVDRARLLVQASDTTR